MEYKLLVNWDMERVIRADRRNPVSSFFIYLGGDGRGLFGAAAIAWEIRLMIFITKNFARNEQRGTNAMHLPLFLYQTIVVSPEYPSYSHCRDCLKFNRCVGMALHNLRCVWLGDFYLGDIGNRSFPRFQGGIKPRTTIFVESLVQNGLQDQPCSRCGRNSIIRLQERYSKKV